ncbi:MAG: spore cortex biosynthesis protein YabQ [Oscillospiraceae bacterium]|jgi:spore cortex biosynthesis protein YabQ|nr:spore cortex biosynthesis protein YabQ [Oscillospiraceae bacterium]
MNIDLLITNGEQAFSFVEALTVGVFVGIYYDIFRILRKIFDCKYVSVVIQDLFFWLTASVGIFFSVVWFNQGTFRLYFLVLIFVGWLIYYFTLGFVLLFITDFAVKRIRKICRFILEKFLLPPYRKISRWISEKIVSKAKSKVKSRLQIWLNAEKIKAIFRRKPKPSPALGGEIRRKPQGGVRSRLFFIKKKFKKVLKSAEK